MDHDGSPPSLAVETGGKREGEGNSLGWLEGGKGKGEGGGGKWKERERKTTEERMGDRQKEGRDR